MRLFRRSGLPQDVRARLPLQRGERVLAWARAAAGQHVVATDRALYWERSGQGEGPRDEQGGQQPARLGWESVEWAGWDDEASTLNVIEAGRNRRRHTLPLAEPGFLPETVRERVMSNIVVSQHVRLAGNRGVRITGRRSPGATELRWTFSFDPGLNPDDPAVRVAAERALAELRVQTGV